MKFDNVNSTCTCDSYHNATVKYSLMLKEILRDNESLREKVTKLQIEIYELKKQIK
jgi:hypothetical protein